MISFFKNLYWYAGCRVPACWGDRFSPICIFLRILINRGVALIMSCFLRGVWTPPPPFVITNHFLATPSTLASTWKYLKVPASTWKYLKVPVSTWKYLKVPEIIYKYLQVLASTCKCMKLPKSTWEYLEVPESIYRDGGGGILTLQEQE